MIYNVVPASGVQPGLPRNLTPPTWAIPELPEEFPAPYMRVPLGTCFICSRVYMAIPIFPYIPPSTHPLGVLLCFPYLLSVVLGDSEALFILCSAAGSQLWEPSPCK